jgi:amidase
MSDLHDLTAVEQAAVLRSGEVTPTELTQHYLDRIDKLDGVLGAYLTVTADLALEQAARATSALRNGERLSPLHGIPVPVKDLNFVAGVRCTFGSRAYRDHTAGRDDHVVTRLRDAGTIMLGKTNTPEFALPCYTENGLAPPTRNPWDPTRSPAGSSGGSAAAVAAGLAPLAQGSDAGGSIRMPASACGVVGIKPSRGRVSNGPAADILGLSVNGPLARTVPDAAALLDVMAGPMPGDTASAPPLPAGETFYGHALRAPSPLRIAAVLSPMVPGVEVHPDCVRAHREVAELLDGLGHHVDELSLPAQPHVVAMFARALSVLASLPRVRDEAELMPFTRWLRTRSAEVSALELAGVIGVFHAAGVQLAEQLFSAYDVMLSPTLAQPPGPIGSLRNDADPEAEFATMAGFMPYTALQNITGLPSVNVPGRWNADGIPIGVMLTGRFGDDATLISLAAQLENAVPWIGHTPPVW